MHITHVLRGEDLLSSTPRQIVLYRALVELGLAERVPAFGHLPYVMGEGRRKLSKRDPSSSLFVLREAGFIPEGLDNYLALLGWSIAPDRDVFTQREMVESFDIGAVSPNPARFDLAKAKAINAAHIRRLDVGDLAERLVPFLYRAGLVSAPTMPALTPAERVRLTAATPLVAQRLTALGEAVAALGFLFIPDDQVAYAPEALAAMTAEAPRVLGAARAVLEAEPAALFPVGLTGGAETAPAGPVAGGAGAPVRGEAASGELAAANLQAVLRVAIVDGLGLAPRVAFAPLRVAMTGRQVSPPLFESMGILGREACLARLARLEDHLVGAQPHRPAHEA
jgi:glutamyl-tRNA synthetase